MPFDFSAFDAVLLDLDGTLYHEEHPLPGAAELVARLAAASIPFACLTNSTTSPQRLAARLARMSIAIGPERIYTAAAAAADYILTRFGQAGPPAVFNLATEGVEEMLEGRVRWVTGKDQPCQVVIAGTTTNVYATDERQRTALVLLRAGAALVGICADRVYPSPRGIEFGSGAFCAFLGYAGDVVPVFCGKPQPTFFQQLCDRLKVAPERCVLIGDNLESDIAGGKAMGMTTILTFTGVTARPQLHRLHESKKPHHLVDDLTQLL